jgi:hypothetical protein
MVAESSRYKSFLLTIWEERSKDPRTETSWRFSLEDPHSGKRRGFSSLQALVEALREEIDPPHEKKRARGKSKNK